MWKKSNYGIATIYPCINWKSLDHEILKKDLIGALFSIIVWILTSKCVVLLLRQFIKSNKKDWKDILNEQKYWNVFFKSFCFTRIIPKYQNFHCYLFTSRCCNESRYSWNKYIFGKPKQTLLNCKAWQILYTEWGMQFEILMIDYIIMYKTGMVSQ